MASQELSQVAQQMAAGAASGGVAVGVNSYKFKKFKESFVGSDATTWLCERFRITRATAVELGQRMMDTAFVEGLVPGGERFSDSALLYRFTSAVFSSTAKPARSSLSVVFTDGTEKKFDMDTRQTVRACVDRVAEAVGLVHGVKEWSLRGKRGWLSPDLPVADQWNEIDGALEFVKKYYLTDASLPEACQERVLLFHQLRQLVAAGVYICNAPQHIRFTALAAQVTYGDRDANKHGPGFLRLREFMPADMHVHEGEALALWTCLQGKTREEAIFDYTRTCATDLATYGVTRFAVTESGAPGKAAVRELGITQSHIFRIVDNVIAEQIRLEDVRTWNFTPKTIEFEFVAKTRDKYVAGTPRGREILAMLSEYQYYNRTRAGGAADTVRVHFHLEMTSASTTRACQLDLTQSAGEIIRLLLKMLNDDAEFRASSKVPLQAPEYYSLRSSSRWLSRDEKLGGLRETELWMEPRTELHLTAEAGELASMEALVASGACPIDAVDIHKDTALHLAVRKRQKRAILLLLDAGANPALCNLDKETAIGDTLDLSQCGITKLPASLAQCVMLRRLNLRNNALMTLPAELAQLAQSLTELQLEGNPLFALPPAVAAGGMAEFARFMGSVTQSDEWVRAKVVFCGPLASGKSTIVGSIATPQLLRVPPPPYVPTRGLDVCDVVLDGASAIELRCFDCSGALPHAVEQLCYSATRTVYCIVQRFAAADVADVEHRMAAIRRAATASVPVLVLLTYTGDAAPKRDEVRQVTEAMKSAPGVVAVLAVDVAAVGDAINGAVMPALLAAINSLPRLREPVLQSFRCLQSFARRFVERETPPEIASMPPLVSNTVKNTLFDFFHPPTQPLPPVLLNWSQFEDMATDCFVPDNAASVEAAAACLDGVGALSVVHTEHGRRMVLLDPTLVARRWWQLHQLKGACPSGVLSMAVVRSLWADLRSSCVVQHLRMMEELDLLLMYANLVFVPSLMDAPAAPIVDGWSTLQLKLRHVAEWRFESTVPAAFAHALWCRLGRTAGLRLVAAWDAGAVMLHDATATRTRIELVGSERKRLVVSVATAAAVEPPPALALVAQAHCAVADAIATLLAARPFVHSVSRAERFVRVLGLAEPKAVLLRHTDLLDYHAKGKASVPVKGQAVPLYEVLLLLPPTAPVSAPTAMEARLPPMAWQTATTLPVLASCVMLAAETASTANSALALMKCLANDASLARLVPRADMLGLTRVLDGASLKRRELNETLLILWELCRRVAANVSNASGLSPVGAAAATAAALQSDVASVFDVVTFVHAAELGERLDDASVALLRALANKFSCAVQLLLRFTDESVGESWRKEQRDKARTLARNMGFRMRLLHAYAAAATTLEAQGVVKRLCAQLHSVECAELAALLAQRAVADVERQQMVLRALASTVQQLELALRSASARESAAVMLQTLTVAPAAYMGPHATFPDVEKVLAIAASARHAIRELPLPLQLRLPAEVPALLRECGEGPLYARLAATQTLSDVLGERADATAERKQFIVARLKSAVAAMSSLVGLATQEAGISGGAGGAPAGGGGASPSKSAGAKARVAVLQACEALDPQTDDLLEALPTVKSGAALLTLVNQQRAGWNAVLEAARAFQANVAPAVARQRFSSTLAAALEAVGDLWGAAFVERDAAGRARLRAQAAALRDGRLAVQLRNIGADAPEGLVAAVSGATTWSAARTQLEAALRGGASEDVLLRGLEAVCGVVRSVGVDCDAAETILCAALALVDAVETVHHWVHHMQFAAAPPETAQCFRLVNTLALLIEGSRSSKFEQCAASLRTALASAAAAGEQSDAAATATITTQLRAALGSLRTLHRFATRAMASASRTRLPPNDTQLSVVGPAFARVADACVSLARAEVRPLATGTLPLLKGIVEAFAAMLEQVRHVRSAAAVLESARVAAGAVARLRGQLMDAERLEACAALVRQTFSPVDSASAEDAAAAPFVLNAEFEQRVDAAILALTAEATHQPLGLPARLEVVCKLVAQLVESMRGPQGVLRRCYKPFAAVYAGASGRLGAAAFKWPSAAETLLLLASCVSLLCEALEDQRSATRAGQTGMAAVRDAVMEVARAQSGAQIAVHLPPALRQLSAALDSMSALQTDYVRVQIVVGVGHALQTLLSAGAVLVLDFANLRLQRLFTKARNRLVAALQQLYHESRLIDEELRVRAENQQLKRTDSTTGSQLRRADSATFAAGSGGQTPKLKRADSSGTMSRQSGKSAGGGSGSSAGLNASSDEVEVINSSSSSSSFYAKRLSGSHMRGGGSPTSSSGGTSPVDGSPRPMTPERASPRPIATVALPEPKTRSHTTLPSAVVPSLPLESPKGRADTVKPASSPRAVPSPRNNSAATLPAASPPQASSGSPRPAPPSVPPPKPSGEPLMPSSQGVRVRAIFKYQAKSDDELSFQRGDVIVLAPGTNLAVAGNWRGFLETSPGPFLVFSSKYTKRVE